MFVCPDCQKQLKTNKSLKRHQETQHQGGDSGEEGELEVLEVKVPETAAPPGKGGYHCVDCGQSDISLGDQNCPGCGCDLDWSGMQDG